MDDSQKLIIEIEGPEEKIQNILEDFEKKVDNDKDLKINAVTIRTN